MGPQWAILHQLHIDLAILWVLGPQWATGAAVWNTGKSMSLQAFWVPNEPSEPLCEPHVDLALKGSLGPHWDMGAILWTTCKASVLWSFCVRNGPLEPVYINVIYN